jgi:hypothetical protein
MSITTDSLVGDIQQMFKNINERTLNYWGVAYGDQFASLSCLKCSKRMYDFREFAEFGPESGRNLWFCRADAMEFHKKISLLENTAEAEMKDFKELYEKALEPLREMEKFFGNYSETRTAQLTGKKWVFFS